MVLQILRLRLERRMEEIQKTARVVSRWYAVNLQVFSAPWWNEIERATADRLNVCPPRRFRFR